MSREFHSLDNKMARLYFLSCSDLVVLTLQLLACSTCVTNSGESPLVSQLRGPVASHLFFHTLDQFFTLSHTQPLHYSHLNTKFLNTELQANLTQNKVNTQLNKFNPKLNMKQNLQDIHQRAHENIDIVDLFFWSC